MADQKQYFHASPHAFAPGDRVIPGKHVGANGARTFKHGDVSNAHVFMARNVTDAQTWARIIGPAALAGDVHIYLVRPTGKVKDTSSDESRTSEAVVIKRVLTLPEPQQFVPYETRWDHDFVEPDAAPSSTSAPPRCGGEELADQ